MKFVLLLALFLLFVSCQEWKEIEFKVCTEDPNPPLRAWRVRQSPIVIKPGTNLTFSTSATARVQVEGGVTTSTVTYLGINVRTQRNNLCELVVEPKGCPIKVGNYTTGLPNEVPRFAPRGNYVSRARTVDFEGRELGCVEIRYTIE